MVSSICSAVDIVYQMPIRPLVMWLPNYVGECQ